MKNLKINGKNFVLNTVKNLFVKKLCHSAFYYTLYIIHCTLYIIRCCSTIQLFNYSTVQLFNRRRRSLYIIHCTLYIILSLSSFAFADFTLGIYGVNDENEIPVIKQAGFNTVQTYNQNPEYISRLAEKTKQYDMQLLVYPNRVIGGEYENEAHNYPMSAWYICDEPDVNHVSYDNMTERDSVCKNTFPEHKTAFVIGQGKTKIAFYDICDILMMDWYPVPHLPLESFGQNVALAKQGMIDSGCPDKPLWAVVQIFDWKEFKQFRPDNDRIGRFPTKEEIRFMSYDAIFNGATGLFYFVYGSKGIPLPKSRPDEWKYISEVIQELSFMGNIFENGEKIKPSVKVKTPLKIMSYKYEGEKYTVVENPTNESQPLPKKFFNKKKFELLFENISPQTPSQAQTPSQSSAPSGRESSSGKSSSLIPPYHPLVFKHI